MSPSLRALKALQWSQRHQRTALGWRRWQTQTHGWNHALASGIGLRPALIAALTLTLLLMSPSLPSVHAEPPPVTNPAPSLLPPPIDLATQASQTLYGIDTFDHSGTAVSDVGDVNGDGYDDLLIGGDWRRRSRQQCQ